MYYLKRKWLYIIENLFILGKSANINFKENRDFELKYMFMLRHFEVL